MMHHCNTSDTMQDSVEGLIGKRIVGIYYNKSVVVDSGFDQSDSLSCS
jgi:hypothetical protein